MKYLEIIKENLKSFIIIAFLLLLIILMLFFIFSDNKEENVLDINNNIILEEEEKEEIKAEEKYLPVVFLTEEELIELGLNKRLKAQVINRDPLVYKIIRSDEDIVKQLAP